VEDDKLAQEFIKDLKSRNIDSPLDKVKNIVRLVKERCNFVKDFWDNSDYFFVAPNSYAEKALKKRWKEGTSERMCIIAERMKEIGDNSSWADNTEEFLMKYIAENELNMGQIMNSIRLAVVGDTKGVNMVDIMRILGKQEIISRITTAAERINL
jgi:glutamyl-tRNA synthetase